MPLEIDSLESKNAEQDQVITSTRSQLKKAEEQIIKFEARLEALQAETNQQKINLATLTKREKQLTHQLKEKDTFLVQVEKREASLQKALTKY